MKNLLKRYLTPKTVSATSNGYVHSFTLDGIDQPFDAGSLWSGGPWMGKLLKAYLDDHRYPSCAGHKMVHPHVVIELPSQLIQNDAAQSRGVLSHSLIASMEDLHRNSFAKNMEAALEPRYAVRKNPSLAVGEVRVSFGHGIYVAKAGEAKSWQIEQSADGAIWGPATDIYEGQRVAVLGGRNSLAEIPAWPFGDAHAIVVINDPDQRRLDIFSEPAESLPVIFDGELNCHVVQGQGEKAFYIRTTRLKQPVPDNVREMPTSVNVGNVGNVAAAQSAPEPKAVPTALIFPRREPVLETVKPFAVQTDAAHFGAETVSDYTYLPALPRHRLERQEEEQDDDDLTFIRCAPVKTHRLSLVGIALQKVSLYKQMGIFGLQFGVDARGNVIAPAKAEAKLKFAVDSDDALSIETASGRRSVALGEFVPLSNGLKIKLEALAGCDNYLGVYRLPTPISEPIVRGTRFSVGRAQKMLAKLRVLAGPGFLHTAQDKDGERMGLSREHFAMELGKDGLLITSMVEQDRLIHLDENLGVLADQTDTDNLAWELLDKHYLLVGHYLLRYDA